MSVRDELLRIAEIEVLRVEHERIKADLAEALSAWEMYMRDVRDGARILAIRRRWFPQPQPHCIYCRVELVKPDDGGDPQNVERYARRVCGGCA